MEDNFDLRDFLYNNSLLTESKKEKIQETIEESSNKMTKSDLKEKIRKDILAELKKESDDPTVGDEEEAHTGVEEAQEGVNEGIGKTLKNVGLGALGALGIKKYGLDIIGAIIETLPEEKAQYFSDMVQTAIENGLMDTLSTMFEAEGDEDGLDAELDIEEPGGEEDVFSSEDRVEDAEKQAYDSIIQAGRAYKALGENPNMGGLKTMMDQLAYLERAYNYPPREDVFENEK